MNNEFEKNLKWTLLRVSLPSKQILHKIAEKNKLTAMQVWTLCAMENEVPMNTLSHVFGCDASNVTGIVDRLIAMNLMKREEHPQDRRIKLVKLTEKGKTMRSKILKKFREAEAENLKQLTEKEQKAFHKLLLKALPKK